MKKKLHIKFRLFLQIKAGESNVHSRKTRKQRILMVFWADHGVKRAPTFDLLTPHLHFDLLDPIFDVSVTMTVSNLVKDDLCLHLPRCFSYFFFWSLWKILTCYFPKNSVFRSNCFFIMFFFLSSNCLVMVRYHNIYIFLKQSRSRCLGFYSIFLMVVTPELSPLQIRVYRSLCLHFPSSLHYSI